jgi:hypothetical protein
MNFNFFENILFLSNKDDSETIFVFFLFIFDQIKFSQSLTAKIMKIRQVIGPSNYYSVKMTPSK